jgi:magnesium-protoporphyrin O-methyltransferase
MFDDKTARKDLKRYRKKGPSKTTQTLLEAIKTHGIKNGTLLDIGGGVGVIQHELLNAGIDRAMQIDASPAYLEASKKEAERRGTKDRIEYQMGDAVELAQAVDPFDIVTLDRVICCYDDMQALVDTSSKKARRIYAVVYPRDKWWVKVFMRAGNAVLRLLRRSFQAFVHPTEAVEAIISKNGFTRSFHRDFLLWQVALFTR